MKKQTRIISIIAAALSVAATAACTAGVQAKEYVPGTPVKVGLICIHNSDSTYDKNFIDSMGAAVKKLGDRLDGEPIIKTDIPESVDAYNAAKELVKSGCNLIIADSFGHEPFLLRAAKEWPQVTFCHATGTKAKTEGVKNFHNAFASIYEGRYLAGYAAGLKLQEMIDAGSLVAKNYDANQNIKLGYVGAFPYAEVVSGYTAWYLGVKEVVPNVVMDVTFTGEWYTIEGEKAGAATLAEAGAAIISQHADSMGAPGECEKRGIPNITYNIPLADKCPKTYIGYSKIDWAPYYEAVVNAMFDNKAIEGEVNNNWAGTIGTGSVVYDCVDAEHKAALETVKNELVAKTRRVFDCSKFTVKAAKADKSEYSKASYITMDDDGHLTGYLANVDDDENFVGETEAIAEEGGITFFNESAMRSAPYFDIGIDGINKLN